MVIQTQNMEQNLIQLDDEALILAVVSKNTAALGVLYDRYGRLVYSLVFRILNDAAAAEEVTQDVFLQLWNKAWMYRSEQGKLSTWLTRIAHNKAIDLFRKNKTQPEISDQTWAEESEDKLADDLVVEEVIEMQIQALHLRKAISNLPMDQKIVLSLAYFGGMSHQQIAEHLREPLGTIKTRIRLAMMKLHAHLMNSNAVE